MGSLMKLNRLALSLLCAAYHNASQQRQEEVCIFSASSSLGIQDWEFRRAFQYLLGEGLVERIPGTVNAVTLTSLGKAEARRRSESGTPSRSAHLFYLGDTTQQHIRLPEVG